MAYSGCSERASTDIRCRMRNLVTSRALFQLLRVCYAILVTASCLKNTVIIHVVLLGIVMHCEAQTTLPGSDDDLDKDKRALLYFKTLISEDPSGVLSSWNSSAADVCMWQGVGCGIINGTGGVSPYSQRRVTALTLSAMDLLGQISPSLSNLTFLTTLSLGQNRLHGIIPPVLGMLSHLRFLNISSNTINGKIPLSLRNCSNLENVDLFNNQLEGEIPGELFSGLNGLKGFRVSANKLTGSIPPELGNLTSLTALSLGKNFLSGQIPEEVSWLTRLTFVNLDYNSLSGYIPPSIYNLSNLTILGLANNHFTGTIPSGLGGVSLPNLRLLNMYSNDLEGPLPASLANASYIQILDLSLNRLSGPIPANIGSSMKSITKLVLGGNHLLESGDWTFLSSLLNCTQLYYLNLAENNLKGEWPDNIGNMSSQLLEIHMQGNQITGRIPSSIGLLSGLMMLNLDANNLTGPIPDSIGMLKGLLRLHLGTNQLTGEIPPSLSSLSLLTHLDLSINKFTGGIPENLTRGLKSLQYLDLSFNNFTGAQIQLSSSLISVDMSHNSFNGSILQDFSVHANNLNMLNLSHNQLSGEIPSNALANFQVLQELQLKNNYFQGPIPASVTELRGLEALDISNNHFSGPIPSDLVHLALYYLNISFNALQGPVPEFGIFTKLSLSCVEGNNGLCGGIPKLHLPKCLSREKHKHNNNIKKEIPWITLPITFVLIYICIYKWRLPTSCKGANTARSDGTSLSPMLTGSPRSEEDNMVTIKDGIMNYRRMHASPLTRTKTRRVWEGPPRISYYEIFRATRGFSKKNLLGSGWFGLVYKGSLSTVTDKIDVAVKVMHLKRKGAGQSFESECFVLRDIQHHNLVPVLTCCVGVDNDGNDFKALVYEFMPNGNLDDWLHPKLNDYVEGKRSGLSFTQRLGIAIDIARALEYLHLRLLTPIIHCDIKPSNVLLDKNMDARIGDFGLARLRTALIEKDNIWVNSTIGLKGTYGYIAPEYGSSNNVSSLGDVYSFGILLLEMFTGKKPTDDMFRNGLNLHTYVQQSFPQLILNIVDSNLYSSRNEVNIENSVIIHDLKSVHASSRFFKCLESIFRIGLSCSKQNPKERLGIEDAIKDIYAIRDNYTDVCMDNSKSANNDIDGLKPDKDESYWSPTAAIYNENSKLQERKK